MENEIDFENNVMDILNKKYKNDIIFDFENTECEWKRVDCEKNISKTSNRDQCFVHLICEKDFLKTQKTIVVHIYKKQRIVVFFEKKKNEKKGKDYLEYLKKVDFNTPKKSIHSKLNELNDIVHWIDLCFE